MFSKTTAWASGCSAVACAFQARTSGGTGAGGALREATSRPFKYATKPSSYFTRSVSESNAVGSATSKGTRMYTELFVPYMADSTSVPIRAS